MRALSGLGIALSLLFVLLLVAFVFEVYYLLWWKRRITSHDSEEERAAAGRRRPAASSSILPILCCSSDHSSSLSTAPLNAPAAVTNECYGMKPDGEFESEFVRFHEHLTPVGGALFTIKEETREELESEEWRSKRGSRGRSLSDVPLPAPETPYLTPLSSPLFFTPPMTPLAQCGGFNPLFEAAERGEAVWVMASPPPTFRFLRDAEEKLYRRTLVEEAARVQRGVSGLGAAGGHCRSSYGNSPVMMGFSSSALTDF